jgi:hypothetical protein
VQTARITTFTFFFSRDGTTEVPKSLPAQHLPLRHQQNLPWKND